VRRLLGLCLAVVAVVTTACSSGSSAAASSSTAGGPAGAGNTAGAGNAAVERVVDGDTIVATIEGRSERVRLIGVDTPESVKPNTPVQCFGKEASEHTTELLPKGTPIRLVRDAEPRDDFGRLLAYVYRARDGLFVNRDLAEQGYARVLTIAPNVAHATEFVAAVRDAKNASRGLWSQCERTGGSAG
jgi:micrococcal nuclease